MQRHCLGCDALIASGSRCGPCQAPIERVRNAAGQQRRGRGWTAKSKALRGSWAAQGRGCVDAADGRCRGDVQADHVLPGSTAEGYAPRCAFHNASKGAKV